MNGLESKLLFNEKQSHVRERRGSRRCEAPAALRLTSFEDRNCVVLDVSAGGARVLSTRRFEKGDDFTLVAGLPHSGQLALKGRVVWVGRNSDSAARGDACEIGVGFSGASPGDIDLFRRYI